MGWSLFAHWLVEWPEAPSSERAHPDEPDWFPAERAIERARAAHRVAELARVRETLRAFELPPHREPDQLPPKRRGRRESLRECHVQIDCESLRQLQCLAAHLDWHAAPPRNVAELEEAAALRPAAAPRVWRFAQVHRALSCASRTVLLPGPPRPVLDLDADRYRDVRRVGDLARVIAECTKIANILGATRELDREHDWWLETASEDPSFPGIVERVESPGDLWPAASASLALVHALRRPLELGSACFLEPSY